MLVISPGIRNLVSSHKRTLLAAVFVFLYSVSITLAVPPSTKYAPGSTLDPACSPGDTNCSVQILSEQTGNAGSLLTTNGNLTEWTDALSGATITFTDIPNSALVNASITINGSPVALGGSVSNLALTTSSLSQFAATTSAELAGVLSDETGSGLSVFATSPTLTTPNIGAATATSIATSGAYTQSGTSANTFTGTSTFSNATYSALFMGGNVGVGTSTPSDKLTINSSTNDVVMRLTNTATGTTTNDGLMLEVGSTGHGYVWNWENANMYFGTNNAITMTMLANGNIGIGTTDPQNLLQLHGNAVIRLTNATTGAGNSDGLFIGNADSTSLSFDIWNYESGSLRFATANTARLTIDSSGNLTASDLAGTGNRCLYADSTGQINAKGFDCGSASGGDNLGDHVATQNIALGSNWLSGDGGNEGIRIDASGNVGVGVAVPLAPLDVQAATSSIRVLSTTGTNYAYQTFFNTSGAVYLGAENSAGGGIFTGSAAYSGVIGSMGARAFHVATNGIVRQTIDSSGNVGVGTSAPARLFHIDGGASNPYFMMTNTASGATSSDGFQIVHTGTTTSLINRENGFLAFETNNTEQVRIAADGNFGIGATNPLSKLSVVSTDNTLATDILKFTFDNSNNYRTGIGVHFSVATPSSNAMTFRVSDGTTTGQTSVMTLLGSGNVGIGTTNPLNKLHVTGTTRISNSDGVSMFYMTHGATTGTTYSEIDALIGSGAGYGNLVLQSGGGNVGIGTTAPGGKLDVNAAGSQIGLKIGYIEGAYPSDYYAAFTHAGNGNGISSLGGLQIIAQAATDLQSGQNIVFAKQTGVSTPVVQMIILNNGSVGIGTTTPDSYLDGIKGLSVYGAANAGVAIANANRGYMWYVDASYSNNFMLWDSTANVDRMTVTTSGNVGIGTTAPASKLEVVGNIKLGNTLDNTSRYIGRALNASSDVTSNYGSIGFISSTTDDYLTFNTHKTGVSQGERMRIDALGNVGIGTTGPGAKLDVVGNIRAIGSTNALIGAYAANSSSPQFALGNAAGTDQWVMYQTLGASGQQGTFNIYDAVAGANRFSIAPTTGFVSIGGASSIYQFNIASANGNLIKMFRSTSTVEMFMGTGPTVFYITTDNSQGVSLTSGATSWGAYSDERMKVMNEFTPFDNALDKILSLRAGTSRYKIDSPGISRSFLIAQDVQNVLPEAVSVGQNGMLSLRYQEVIPLLVASDQEIGAILEGMQLQVHALPEFEDDGSMAAKVAEFLEGIAEGIANIGQVQTSKLCVDDICVTRDQFLNMVQYAGEQPLQEGGQATPEPESDPTPDPSPESQGEDSAPTEEPAPEPEPEPTPEPPAPDPVPTE